MNLVKKFCSGLVFIALAISTHAQESKLIVAQKSITDWQSYPVYPYLTEEREGEKVWKDAYHYMDSIEVSGITYMSDGLKVKGFVVKPKAEGTYPCIIFNRGGNRDFSSLTVGAAAVLLGRLARNGYVVIASQYRGNAGGDGVEEFGGADVNDVLILPDVLEEVAGADTERIGMYGWSRGGMMTYIALTKTDRIKAAAVGGALSDQFSSIEDREEMETRVLAELIPDYETNRDNELRKRSAVMWADKFPKDVPLLIMHGSSDWRVKPDQSLRLALELDKNRVPYRLIMFEGSDHGINEHRDEVNEQVVDWFDRFLKNDEPLPDMEFHGK